VSTTGARSGNAQRAFVDEWYHEPNPRQEIWRAQTSSGLLLVQPACVDIDQLSVNDVTKRNDHVIKLNHTQ